MKDVAVQTQIESNISPRLLSKIPLLELEYPQILYHSHTVIWLQLSICILGFLAFSHDDSTRSTNYKFGIISSICLFLFISAVHLPDSGFLSRPHPILWRTLQGLAFCYLMFLTFLLFQNLNDGRIIFSWIDEKLNKPLPEKTYAANCDIFTPFNKRSFFANVQESIFDIYVPAHAIGWWFKMIIVRDVKLCLFLSFLFEFLEISLKYQLPNFEECWWDSLILDVILCNGGGIFLGWATCRSFQMKEYYWGVGDDSRTKTEKFSGFSRFALQLTPYTWSVYKWEMLSSSKDFVMTLWFIIFVNLVDLSNFYLKFIFWLPSSHPILLGRVLFWAVLAIASTREYFEYVSSGFRIRLGVHCWIAHFLVFVEWMIIVKNSKGMFTEPMPLQIQYIWTLIAGFLIAVILRLGYKDLGHK